MNNKNWLSSPTQDNSEFNDFLFLAVVLFNYKALMKVYNANLLHQVTAIPGRAFIITSLTSLFPSSSSNSSETLVCNVKYIKLKFVEYLWLTCGRFFLWKTSKLSEHNMMSYGEHFKFVSQEETNYSNLHQNFADQMSYILIEVDSFFYHLI